MHDLHLANKIYKLVLGEAQKNKLSQVKRIVIELGSIIEHDEEVNARNLKFNIQTLARNGLAEEAKIEIIKKDKGNFWRLVEIEGE